MRSRRISIHLAFGESFETQQMCVCVCVTDVCIAVFAGCQCCLEAMEESWRMTDKHVIDLP